MTYQTVPVNNVSRWDDPALETQCAAARTWVSLLLMSLESLHPDGAGLLFNWNASTLMV